MTHFKFSLCGDIEKNPCPGAQRHFINYCFLGHLTLFLNLLLLFLRILYQRSIAMCFFQIILDACLQLENYDEQTDIAMVQEPAWANLR